MPESACGFEQSALKQPIDGELIEAENLGGLGGLIRQPGERLGIQLI